MCRRIVNYGGATDPSGTKGISATRVLLKTQHITRSYCSQPRIARMPPSHAWSCCAWRLAAAEIGRRAIGRRDGRLATQCIAETSPQPLIPTRRAIAAVSTVRCDSLAAHRPSRHASLPLSRGPSPAVRIGFYQQSQLDGRLAHRQQLRQQQQGPGLGAGQY